MCVLVDRPSLWGEPCKDMIALKLSCFIIFVFQSDHYVPVAPARCSIDVRSGHSCMSKSTVTLSCVDIYGNNFGLIVEYLFYLALATLYYAGMEHELQFVYCSCEALPITMARAKLWPATPSNPRFCLSFELLDWVEALMLESQVSLKGFCKTVDFRCPFSAFRVK